MNGRIDHSHFLNLRHYIVPDCTPEKQIINLIFRSAVLCHFEMTDLGRLTDRDAHEADAAGPHLQPVTGRRVRADSSVLEYYRS